MLDIMSNSKNNPKRKIEQVLTKYAGMEMEKHISILFAEWALMQPLPEANHGIVLALERLDQLLGGLMSIADDYGVIYEKHTGQKAYQGGKYLPGFVNAICKQHKQMKEQIEDMSKESKQVDDEAMRIIKRETENTTKMKDCIAVRVNRQRGWMISGLTHLRTISQVKQNTPMVICVDHVGIRSGSR